MIRFIVFLLVGLVTLGGVLYSPPDTSFIESQCKDSRDFGRGLYEKNSYAYVETEVDRTRWFVPSLVNVREFAVSTEGYVVQVGLFSRAGNYTDDFSLEFRALNEESLLMMSVNEESDDVSYNIGLVSDECAERFKSFFHKPGRKVRIVK